MAKRISGTPRRPRNPVAKAVRTPAFRMRVVPDKRRQEDLRQAEKELVKAKKEGRDDNTE